MAYVEWLRVKKTLIVLSIVLGAIFLIAVIVRVSINGKMNSDFGISQSVEGGHAVTKTLADGSTETTYTDPRTHRSFDVIDRGWYGKHISYHDPEGSHRYKNHGPVTVGPLHIQASSENNFEMDTNGPLDVGQIFGFLTLIGVIIATCLGAPLGRENERLEIAWTKPIDRTLYALQLYAVDFAGIVASLVMSVIAAIVILSLFQFPHLTLTMDGVWHIALSFAVCAAWYGMYSGLTSWMKRGIGAVIGIAWPVALLVPGLAVIPMQGSAVGDTFHWIFQAIAAIDPLAYLHLTMDGSHSEIGLAAIAEPTKLIILLALTLIYAGAGLFEWRRVEA